MRYWVLDLVPSPGKALPGEVDRCLTGPRGMIHIAKRVAGMCQWLQHNGADRDT
ncbi:unnamed protein product [Brassica napus]|uniref:(rape) hypothetical protein n=1 Tax=Brassica napus TaxID=3708 RepID=A0A816R5A1_BRANA|nr:unnamed protein product [Brassica napus]